MKLTKTQLELEKGINKEWIITNGIGGYASSTIFNCNTRKYHGLLVAPLTPPARRFVVISKIDESIEIENEKFNLYTNMGKDYISEGFKYLKEFEKEYVPIFTYKVKDIVIKKIICMKQGENTVCIYYKIKNGAKKAKLTLAPIINFRDFHTINKNTEFDVKQEIKQNKVKIVLNKNSQMPIYFYSTQGEYIPHEKDIFFNMFYLEEEKRGFEAQENHCVIGRYEIEIQPKEEKEIEIVCSLEENIEEVTAKNVINEQIKRIERLVNNSKLIPNEKITKEWIRDYIIASENFIVYRPAFRLHTIIAGYPWFLDWGRDALISYEGILLKTRQFEIAKEVMYTFTRNVKYGLLPNGYSGFDNRPLYNSADASLLLFEQVKKYINYTNDIEFIKQKIYPVLKKIISSYKSGIDFDDNNIYLDSDYLIVTGTSNTQNTWMDAKCNGIAITPRNGKAVEINSLWYNALKIMEELTTIFESKEEAKEYQELAKKCKISFEKKFYNSKKKCLFDVLGDSKIRPNQLFSLSLTYPVIDVTSEIADNILTIVENKLLTKHGLKTLAKEEKEYVDVYEGDSLKRDSSYHQGITWPWLFGLYYDSLKNKYKNEKNKNKKEEVKKKIENFREEVRKTFIKGFYQDKMIGSIAELYDSKPPYLAKGAPAQCWSVAEIGRILLEQ